MTITACLTGHKTVTINLCWVESPTVSNSDGYLKSAIDSFLSQIGAHFPGADGVAEQRYKVSNKLLLLFFITQPKKCPVSTEQ